MDNTTTTTAMDKFKADTPEQICIYTSNNTIDVVYGDNNNKKIKLLFPFTKWQTSSKDHKTLDKESDTDIYAIDILDKLVVIISKNINLKKLEYRTRFLNYYEKKDQNFPSSSLQELVLLSNLFGFKHHHNDNLVCKKLNFSKISWDQSILSPQTLCILNHLSMTWLDFKSFKNSPTKLTIDCDAPLCYDDELECERMLKHLRI